MEKAHVDKGEDDDEPERADPIEFLGGFLGEKPGKHSAAVEWGDRNEVMFLAPMLPACYVVCAVCVAFMAQTPNSSAVQLQ